MAYETLSDDLEIAAGIPLKELIEALNGKCPTKEGDILSKEKRRIERLCKSVQKMIGRINFAILGD